MELKMKFKCVGLRYLDKEPRTFVGKVVIEESEKEYEVTLTDENAPEETIIVKVRLAKNGKELYILTQEPLEYPIRHYFYLWERGKKFIM